MGYAEHRGQLLLGKRTALAQRRDSPADGAIIDYHAHQRSFPCAASVHFEPRAHLHRIRFNLYLQATVG